MKKILIIEDDELIAGLERDYLLAEGMAADIVTDGNKGLPQFEKETYEAVILDLMLPGMNGFDICRKLREKSDVPILLVTARKEDIDKIRGLGLGADDYVVKPFSATELVARVKAHMGIHSLLKQETEERCMKAADLEIYPDSYRVYKNGIQLELTRREFELLVFMAENPNIVFSRERLFDQIWGMDAIGDMSTVTVHVNKLREKIEGGGTGSDCLIKTVRGVGYRFQS